MEIKYPNVKLISLKAKGINENTIISNPIIIPKNIDFLASFLVTFINASNFKQSKSCSYVSKRHIFIK